MRTKYPNKKERWKAALQNPNYIRRLINTESFFEFFQYFWGEVSSDELKLNWHIEYICDELQDLAKKVINKTPLNYDFLIINIPPGTTKSTIVSRMFPIWAWTISHKLKFITASYASSLSLELATDSRDLLKGDIFKKVYPEYFVKQDKDTKSNFKVVKKLQVNKGQMARGIVGGSRYSTSVGGAITGFHAHIIIIDDPLDPRRAHSKVELDKANKWISQTLLTRKVDKANSPIILIMQRLSQNDCTGYLLKIINKKRVKHISLPAEIRNYKEEVKPKELISRYQNDLLDPIRLNWKELQKLKEGLGQYGYAGQMGQKPSPPGGGMFLVDNFSIVDRVPEFYKVKKTLRYWDKAGSAGTGAYTVGVKMSLLNSGTLIILNVKRGQWASHVRERIIKQTAEADGVDCSIYYEQEPGSGGKQSAEETTKNLMGFSAHADLPRGDKVYRADPYSVQVNNGNVQILTGEWNHEFIEEHRFFPFSTYKDQVDAASGAFSKLVGRKLARVI